MKDEIMTSRVDFRTVIEKIITVLKEKYQPEKVILFGSYANGRPDESSDIDLLIVKNTSNNLHKRIVEVRKIISSFRKGWGLDIWVITPEELQMRQNMNDQFIEKILSEGKVLYAS